jgi:hypothetical protein
VEKCATVIRMRNLKIILVLLAVALLGGFIGRAYHGVESDHAERVQAAALPEVQKPDADTLAVRASRFDVISSCGKPTKVWMTSSGRWQYESDTWHLWYPKVPAEVLIVAYPGGSESERHWIFTGAFPSLTSDDYYDSAKLSKKMPCVARWANVYARLSVDIMKKYGN